MKTPSKPNVILAHHPRSQKLEGYSFLSVVTHLAPSAGHNNSPGWEDLGPSRAVLMAPQNWTLDGGCWWSSSPHLSSPNLYLSARLAESLLMFRQDLGDQGIPCLHSLSLYLLVESHLETPKGVSKFKGPGAHSLRMCLYNSGVRNLVCVHDSPGIQPQSLALQL